MTEITYAEYLVLRAAVETGEYQPSREALAAADRLAGRGLLDADPEFPAVTIATDDGRRAYWDVRGEVESGLDAMEDEAKRHGDLAQARICQRAMHGHEASFGECVRVVLAARAMA